VVQTFEIPRLTPELLADVNGIHVHVAVTSSGNQI